MRACVYPLGLSHSLSRARSLSLPHTQPRPNKMRILNNTSKFVLIPLSKNIVLDKTGVLVQPLAVFYEGYWSYEKFGNSLPLDYVAE